MACPIVWFEAVGQHADKLHSFYGEVLGWRFDPQRTPTPKAAAANPRSRAGAAAPEHEPPWWITYYSRVPDLEAAIEKARSLGSRLLVAPTRHGDSRIAVVSDPEGHPIGLCGQ
jgi:hypothetical protein